mgnify:CR=1 FL=1
MKIINLESAIKPSALRVAMNYRKESKNSLCKKINGLNLSDLIMFLNGFHGRISDEKLKEIKFINITTIIRWFENNCLYLLL